MRPKIAGPGRASWFFFVLGITLTCRCVGVAGILRPELRRDEWNVLRERIVPGTVRTAPHEIQALADELAEAAGVYGSVEVKIARYRGHPNAAAIDCGLIVVDERLLSKDVWPAVLAHEMGHIAAMHSRRWTAQFARDFAELERLRQQAADNPARLDKAFAEWLGRLMENIESAAVTEVHEYEADSRGAAYLWAIGRDPAMMLNALQAVPAHVPGWLITGAQWTRALLAKRPEDTRVHPSAEARRARLAKYIQRVLQCSPVFVGLSEQGRWRVWPTWEPDTYLAHADHTSGIADLEFSPDCSRIAYLSSRDKNWYVHDLITGHERPVTTSGNAGPCAWGPAGVGIAVVSNGELWVTGVQGITSIIKRRLLKRVDDRHPLAWSPRGDWIACSHEGKLVLLGVHSGRILTVPPPNSDVNTSTWVGFSPDGQYLAVCWASTDWDAPSSIPVVYRVPPGLTHTAAPDRLEVVSRLKLQDLTAAWARDDCLVSWEQTLHCGSEGPRLGSALPISWQTDLIGAGYVGPWWTHGPKGKRVVVVMQRRGAEPHPFALRLFDVSSLPAWREVGETFVMPEPPALLKDIIPVLHAWLPREALVGLYYDVATYDNPYSNSTLAEQVTRIQPSGSLEAVDDWPYSQDFWPDYAYPWRTFEPWPQMSCGL